MMIDKMLSYLEGSRHRAIFHLKCAEAKGPEEKHPQTIKMLNDIIASYDQQIDKIERQQDQENYP